MLARSFLFKSSSKLLVTRTGIKAWSSSNLVQIRQLILELLALEWRKFHTFELEYLWSEVANLDQILCVASLGWGKGCIRFWGWLTLARWTQVSDRCPLGYLLYGSIKLPGTSSGEIKSSIQQEKYFSMLIALTPNWMLTPACHTYFSYTNFYMISWYFQEPQVVRQHPV